MKLTQGRQLIAHLKRGPMTTMELLRLGISACPWKRIAEQLRPNEVLVKTKRFDGLTVYRVRVKK
jgi:hypothetical protein